MTFLTLRSQIVQVVSMLHAPTNEGSSSFQSNDVKGAQYSVLRLLLSSDSILVSPSGKTCQSRR